MYKYINTEQYQLLIIIWIYKLVKWVTKMVRWVKIFKVKMAKSVSKGIIGFIITKINPYHMEKIQQKISSECWSLETSS